MGVREERRPLRYIVGSEEGKSIVWDRALNALVCWALRESEACMIATALNAMQGAVWWTENYARGRSSGNSDTPFGRGACGRLRDYP